MSYTSVGGMTSCASAVSGFIDYRRNENKLDASGIPQNVFKRAICEIYKDDPHFIRNVEIIKIVCGAVKNSK